MMARDRRGGPRRTVYGIGGVPYVVPAAMLMGILHLFWLIWLRPASIEPSARTWTGPRLQLVSSDDGAAAGSRIWSPVLMALPTPAGFSGAEIGRDLGVGPMVATPAGGARYLDHGPYAAPVSPVGLSGPAAEPPGVDALAAADAPDPVGPLLHYRGPAGIHLEFHPPLGGDRLPGAAVPEGLPRPGTTGWTCDVWLLFNERGEVAHAFVDASTDDPVRDRMILQAVYQWRWSGREPPQTGRVTFHAFGAAPPAADASSREGGP